MVEPITINVRHLSQDVRLPQEQVQAAIDLLDAGLPVPFIARYRKEVTKNLGEEALRTIDEELRSARVLCERKLTILKTIDSAGKLTPELDKNIRDAKSVKRLEDIYAPFKPRRQSPATAARDGGLEPFALEILEGTVPPEKVDERAAEFINEDKNVKSVADVLLGAGHIIADIFGCKAELVQKVRDIFYQHGQLVTTKVETGVRSQETGDRRQEGEEVAAEGVDTADSLSASEIAEEEITEGTSEETSEETSEQALEETSAESAAVCRQPPAASTTDEVTELFEQLKEEQAEKGIQKIISQNTLKKKKRAEAKKKLNEIKQRQREHFERQFAEYFNFSLKLRGVPAHRILAFDRGERHKIIKVELKIDEAKVFESVKEICVPKEHVHADFLAGCLQDALHRNVLPTLTREIRSDMTDYAEKNVIKIFGQNLRTMLLQRPLPRKRVLALDPGGKHGSIAAALDEFGNLVGHETVFLTGNAERRENTAKTLADMVNRFNLSVVAIGIGGGARMAEEAVAHMIETHFADSDLAYIMVNKSGSIAYSTSPTGKEELPNVDTFVRAAVSIGRRLQNPLNELVKVEPTSLGQGTFQHDIRGKHVKQMLAEVVASCVNLVGVDLNSATSAMLNHVSGLNPMTARRIYEHRREHGAFRTREDLRKVPGIGATVYNYAAGFLRIADGENPLDATNIHPESYELAASIIEKLGFAVDDLRSSEKKQVIADKIAADKIGELTVLFASEFNAGINTVRDILDELAKPGRDPRYSQLPLVFRKKVLKLEDLTSGMELIGTILNVTDFGAFVDIGLHESGFIHISQMASGYLQSAHEKVSSGNVVRVWVVEPDAAKKRVSLTLLRPGSERQSSDVRRSGERGERPPREQASRQGGERRDFSSDRPRGDRPPRDSSRDGKRFERKPFDRAPKTFVTAPVKKEVKPITEEMKKGKEPMRSFSDLAQLFGRTPSDEEKGKEEKK